MSVLTVEKKDHTAVITLNRPEAGNALNAELHEALWAAWQDTRFDADVWTTVLTGAGDAFCVGEDLAEIAAALRSNTVPERYKEPRDGRKWGYRYEHYRRRKVNVWKPVVVAINGACNGTGLVFLGQGDTIIASDKATFSMPEVSLGLAPVESLVYLSDRIPLGTVSRMALLGDAEVLSAKRAQEVALVSEVIPHDQLLDRAMTIAATINDQAGDAVRGMTNTMHIFRDMGYDDSLVVGYEYHARFENVENMKEGPLAFTEKRKPNWSIRPPSRG